MEQTSESEFTYASIVDTEEDLLKIISEKFSKNQNLEHTLATVVIVS